LRRRAWLVAACAALAAAGAPALGTAGLVPNDQVLRTLTQAPNPWVPFDIPGDLAVQPPAPGEAPLPREVLGPDQAPPSTTVVPAGAYRIPAAVLEAYREAARRMGIIRPGCNLTWPLLASIGRIESGHARGGDVLANGRTRSPIVGPRLDGTGSFAMISDSDGGAWDGDTAFDRAVGPMQFLPGTWRAYGQDGNGDGVRDPHNIVDAALAAGSYLCASGRDLSVQSDLLNAVFAYNRSWAYVRTVLAWASAYTSGVVPGQALPVGAPARGGGGGVVVAARPRAVTPSQSLPAAPGTTTPSGTPSGTATGTPSGTPSTTPTTAAPGSILGSVKDDLGRGVADVPVQLTGPMASATTTDAAGDFSFGGLPAGTYTVTEGETPGYADESPNVLAGVQVAAGAQAGGLSFTERTSALAGLVFVDGDNDGVQGDGEQGIPEVEIRLTGVDVHGRDVDQTLGTDENGSFLFAGLLSGGYALTEVAQPLDYADGSEHAPLGTASPDDQIVDIVLGAGVLIGGFGFGELPLASASAAPKGDTPALNGTSSGTTTSSP